MLLHDRPASRVPCLLVLWDPLSWPICRARAHASLVVCLTSACAGRSAPVVCALRMHNLLHPCCPQCGSSRPLPLSPCLPANCGTVITKSCECQRRCQEYFCMRTSTGSEFCQGGLPALRLSCTGAPPRRTTGAAYHQPLADPRPVRARPLDRPTRQSRHPAVPYPAIRPPVPPSPPPPCQSAGHGYGYALRNEERACYEREGVAPEDQYSAIPEPAEKHVRCWSTHKAGAAPINCTCALLAGARARGQPSLGAIVACRRWVCTVRGCQQVLVPRNTQYASSLSLLPITSWRRFTCPPAARRCTNAAATA